jgi:hypothetical protein
MLSNEHPWDVDRTGGGNGGGGGNGPVYPIDSLRVRHDGGTASVAPSTTVPGFGSFYSVVARMSMYFAIHQQTTARHQGIDTKGSSGEMSRRDR